MRPTLLVLALLLAASSVWADEVYFTDDHRLKGLVVEEHADRLIVSTADGERTIWRKDIEEVFFDDPERNYLYLGNDALRQGDFNSARALFQKAMQIAPEWNEARDALRRVEDLQRKQTSGWVVADPAAALEAGWGLRLAVTDTYPTVTAVVDGSVAELAGLMVGDRLVTVWGESARYRSVAEAADRLLGPPETGVKITIQREFAIRAAAGPHSTWPGFDLELQPSGIVVTGIRSPNQVMGLRAHDLLIAANGQPTRYLPMASVTTTIRRARVGGLRATIQRVILISRPTPSPGKKEESHG